MSSDAAGYWGLSPRVLAAPPPPPPDPPAPDPNPPTVGLIVTQMPDVAPAGSAWVQLDASDSTGDALDYAYTMDGLPFGDELATNVTTGTATVGAHTFAVTVTDSLGRSLTATRTFTVTGPAPPSGSLVVKLAAVQGMAGQVTWDASGSTPGTYAWTIDGVAVPDTTVSVARMLVLGQHTAKVTVTDASGRVGSATKTFEAVHACWGGYAQGDAFNPAELRWPWAGRVDSGLRTISAVNDGRVPPTYEPYDEGNAGVLNAFHMHVESGDHPTLNGGDRTAVSITGGSYNYTGAGYAVSNGDIHGQIITPQPAGYAAGETFSEPRFYRVEFRIPKVGNHFPMVYTGWRHAANGGIKISATGGPTRDAGGAWVLVADGPAIRVATSTATQATAPITREGVTWTPGPGEPIYVDRDGLHNFFECHGAAGGSATHKFPTDGPGVKLGFTLGQFIENVWSVNKDIHMHTIVPDQWERYILEVRWRTTTDEALRGERGYTRIWYRPPNSTPDVANYTCVSMGISSFANLNGVVTTDPATPLPDPAKAPNVPGGRIFGQTRKTFIQSATDKRNSEPMGCTWQMYRSPAYEWPSAEDCLWHSIGLSIPALLNAAANAKRGPL